MAQHTPTPTQEKDVTPSAPVPARTERRTNTTHPTEHPGSGPENLEGPEARLPHERDEATDMTDGEIHPEVHQAYKDIERGLKDTDRGTPAHEAYQKQKQK